jgi:hypothetical protein
VIITKDKGVSRVHAEIVVNTMNMLNPRHLSASVQIRDCSKYGTFVSKNVGLKKKVHELPNKEATLQDGDLVSFGTGSATYKYVNYIFSLMFYSIFVTLLTFSKCVHKHFEFDLTGFATSPSFFSTVPQIKWIDLLKRKFHQLVSREKTCKFYSYL